MNFLKRREIQFSLILFLLFWTLIFIQCSKAEDSTEGETDYFEGDEMVSWEGGPSYYSKWTNGPSSSTDFFPIAVWLQSPESSNAAKYKNIGINTFIGLYNGPTETQLSALSDISIITFCDQNTVGISSANKGIIRAWTQEDEPDNAVSGTTIPVSTSTIVDYYNEMKNNDGSRPVYLNLGHGVASDTWYGRGNRTNHPEDYTEYAKGGDILSFDIYPMNIFSPLETDASYKKTFKNEIKQKPWYVATGVKRLREWSNYSKPVWTWIECTNIHGNSEYALTPSIVEAEVWMALINGARGIGYFCHQTSPFVEAGLLADAEMTKGVSNINAQIKSLANILNTQSVANGFNVTSGNEEVTIDAMLKRADGYTYLFAVAMRPGTTEVSFTLKKFSDNRTIEVVGEDRSLNLNSGVFQDTFTDYDVHIYKVKNPTNYE